MSPRSTEDFLTLAAEYNQFTRAVSLYISKKFFTGFDKILE